MSGEAGKAASEYQIGDRLSIFTIMAQTKDELLLGIDDSHLDVRVSVLKLSGKSSLNPLVVRAMMRRTAV